MTLLDRNVLTQEPDTDKITMGVVNLSEGKSQGNNQVALVTFSQRGNYALSLSYTLRTWGECMSMMSFFCSVRGGRTKFYVPSWVNEFVVTAPIASGATALLINAVGYLAAFGIGGDASGNCIFAYNAANRSLYVSQVTAVTSASGVETLTLATALPWAADPGDLMVGLLLCCTFADDGLILTFSDPTQASCNLSFVEQPDLPGST